MKSSIPNHDTLAEMARTDPEKLERLRETWINEVIERAPTEMRRRLRGLQFQIDCQRRLHSNPLGACIEISKMMYESLNHLNQMMQGHSEPVYDEPNNATVLAFPGAS